jgi:hypothetical protein
MCVHTLLHNLGVRDITLEFMMVKGRKLTKINIVVYTHALGHVIFVFQLLKGNAVPRQETAAPQSWVDGIWLPMKAPTTLHKFLSQDEISMPLCRRDLR